MSQKVQQHSVLIVAILGVIAAALGVVAAYSRTEVTDVTKQRDAVKGKATELRSEQVDLESEVETLRRENADLRARLADGSAAPGGAAEATDDAEHRRLTVPLPPDGEDEYLLLDRGEVTDECCSGDLTYSRNDNTGIPELTAETADYSTEVASAAVSQEDCVQTVKTSPTITPVRRLRRGTLMCVITEGGTSLLRISSTPPKSGTLKISQTFWPDAPG